MGRICPKANSTVCSKFQMVPINSIAKLVLEINSDTPCCTSQWLLCSEALVVLAMSSIDYSWRKRRVVSSLQLMRATKPKKISEFTNIYHPIPSPPGISHIEFITRQCQGCGIIQEARISSRPRRGWIPWGSESQGIAGERIAEDGHPDVRSVPATCQWNTWSVPLSSWTAGKQTARDGHGQQRLYKVVVFKTAKSIDWTHPDKNSDAMYDTVCGCAVDPGK